jgi:hypothetical protein
MRCSIAVPDASRRCQWALAVGERAVGERAVGERAVDYQVSALRCVDPAPTRNPTKPLPSGVHFLQELFSGTSRLLESQAFNTAG